MCVCVCSELVLLREGRTGERAGGTELDFFVAIFLFLFVCGLLLPTTLSVLQGSKFSFLLPSCLLVSRFQIRLCVFVVPFLFDKNKLFSVFAVVAVHCCQRVLSCSSTRRRSREH